MNHDKDGNGGPSACKWCVNKDLTCLHPNPNCNHPLFGPQIDTGEEGKEIRTYNWILVHKGTDKIVRVGEVFPDNYGDFIITGGHPPRHEASSGRIYSENKELYPHVFNLEWKKIL